MTSLSESKLSIPVVTALMEAGWTGDRRGPGLFESELLRCAGLPVGPRGAQLLEELGGLRIEYTSSACDASATEISDVDYFNKWTRNLWSNKGQVDDVAPVSKPKRTSISFVAADILRWCGPNTSGLLQDVAYTCGKIMSVIGADENDRFLLIDESSDSSYVVDVLAENLAAFEDFESALNGLAGCGSWPLAHIALTRARDGFELSVQSLARYIELGPTGFRFRIYRDANMDRDGCSVEVFILSDCRLIGTIRRNATIPQLIPVHLKVEESEIFALRDIFNNTTSVANTTGFTVGYGNFGQPFDVKFLNPSPLRNEEAANAALNELAVTICNRCLQAAYPNRKRDR